MRRRFNPPSRDAFTLSELLVVTARIPQPADGGSTADKYWLKQRAHDSFVP